MRRSLVLILCVGAASAQTHINGSRTISGTVNYCADAGSNDTYACNLSPAITAYTTGACYFFKANTANTGAASINLNSVGAKTIKKAAGGVTTDLSDNDIRAGQIVTVCYDGTNMQMQSTLGNASGGGGGGSPVAVPWYPIGPYGGGMQNVMAGGAGQGTCHAIYNYVARTSTKVSFNITTATASSGKAAGIGVYDSAGTTLVAYSEDGTSGNGTSTKDIMTTGKKSLNWSGGSAVSAGTLTLNPGKYFVCASASVGDIQTDRWNNLGILNLQVSGDNGYVSGVTSGTSSLTWASTMPSRTFSGNGQEPIQLLFE